MRKRIAIVGFILFFIIGGCEKTNENVSLADFIEEVKKEANFQNGVLEDLKDVSIAQQYGINPESIKQGYVYYEKDAASSEKIVMLEAVDEKSLEGLEKAVQNELTGLNETFGENPDEGKKLSESFIKTKGNYVFLVNATEYKTLEKLLNEKFD